MEVYRNSSGTTKPTFKFGPKGVQLISSLILDSNIPNDRRDAILQLKKKDSDANTLDVITSDLSERDTHNLSEIDPEAPFDAELAKSELVSYSINRQENVIVLWVKDGYVKLPLSADLTNIIATGTAAVTFDETGKSDSIVGHVPLIAAESGKRIKDSGLPIVDTIRERNPNSNNNEEQEVQDGLVTMGAVLEYVGIPKNRLEARILGELENDQYSDID